MKFIKSDPLQQTFTQPHAPRHAAWRRVASLLVLSLATHSFAGIPAVDLTQFYVNYFKAVPQIIAPPTSIPLYDGIPPEWTNVGYDNRKGLPKRTLATGDANVPAALWLENAVLGESFPPAAAGVQALPLSVYQRLYFGPIGGPCEYVGLVLPAKIVAGLTKSYPRSVGGRPLPGTTCDEFRGVSPGEWPVTDQFTFNAPVRRNALDGFEYEASPMSLRRNGVPWMTYYFGYRMGITAGSSNWLDSNRSQLAADFPKFPSSAEDSELIALPPPFVEGEVIEYVNAKVSPSSTGGHYFYAASDSEKSLLDATEDWVRTGRNFKSGGYLPVCRFFYVAPGTTTGTHFYTARADECETFKQTPGFSYEGTPFRASLPKPASGTATDASRCPAATVPLYRFFNNPTAGAYLPNHRYMKNRPAGVGTGGYGQTWTDEGIALCVPL